MPAPLILTFVSTVAFAVQLMIFAYLYQSHRLVFFRYLLLAWGAYTISKGLKLVDVLVLDVDHPSFVTDLTTVAAVGFTLAAALAHRWGYRLRARDVVIGSAVAIGLTLAGDTAADETQRAVGIALGGIQMAAGLLFWPSQAQIPRFRGERLLAAFLTLWGLHRVTTQCVSMIPGSTGYLTVHAVFILLYFLSTFAVIIMVLERAERQRAAARAPARGRAAGDGGRAGRRHGPRDT